MRLFIILCLAAVSFAAVEECDPQKCKREDNCACSTMEQPVENAPQFIMLSFNDAINKKIFDFWNQMLFSRKNPDGCSIGGTFFITHKGSDYETVNALYNHGFEIGSQSITNNVSESYWQNLDKEGVSNEMGGQSIITNTFSNVPSGEITGAHLSPNLFNDITFSALQESNFQYDDSWNTGTKYPYLPHTLNYKSNVVGLEDPVPGFWELPNIAWIDMDGNECSISSACAIRGNEDELYNWMVTNFDRVYKNGNKAPFSISINYETFEIVPHLTGAFTRFLDYFGTFEDVFLVNKQQVVEWSKNPVSFDQFSSCVKREPVPCNPVNCQYTVEGTEINMASCTPCPTNYPWLGNPTGA